MMLKSFLMPLVGIGMVASLAGCGIESAALPAAQALGAGMPQIKAMFGGGQATPATFNQQEMLDQALAKACAGWDADMRSANKCNEVEARMAQKNPTQ